MIVGAASVVIAGAMGAAGCSSSTPTSQGTTSSDGGANNGDAGGGGTTPGDSGGGGTTSDGGGTTSSDAGGGGCALSAKCTAVDKTCVGLVSNAGETKFGLRMSEIDFSSPPAFASGVVAGVVSGAAEEDIPSCNQNGSGTFSWLLQVDTQAQTLKMGGARPVADPTQGFSFDTETLDTFNVAPVTFPNVTPDSSGNFAITQGVDLVIPVFLDPAGDSSFVLPLHQARITQATLSSNNDCVGTYNASGLDPSNSCISDNMALPPVPGFLDGGKLDGYITLTEADTVVITKIATSLCAVLASASGDDAGANTATSGGNTVCARDGGGAVVYQGNWCSTTNAAATSTCADAVKVSASFAASSVEILN